MVNERKMKAKHFISAAPTRKYPEYDDDDSSSFDYGNVKASPRRTSASLVQADRMLDSLLRRIAQRHSRSKATSAQSS